MPMQSRAIIGGKIESEEPGETAMGTHTYEQTVKYEVARDLLNGRIADLSERIGGEEHKSVPDHALIDRLEAQMAGIADELAALDVTNEAALDAVIAANKREPVSH